MTPINITLSAVVLIGLVAVTGCTVGGLAPAPDGAAAIDTADGLRPGDRVAIRVAGEPDLSGTHELDLDGMLDLPLIGSVDAYGRSAAELTDLLATRYADGYLRQPRVDVTRLASRPFFITGAVARPGSYAFAPGLTVADAIALAGDAGDDAVVLRVRQGRAEPVALDAPLAPGDILELVDAAG